MAVAHPDTVWAGAASFRVWAAPFVKAGALLNEFTVIVKVCVAGVSTPPWGGPPLSWIWTETVAEPFALAAGVYVSVPVGETAGCAENRPALLLETMKLTV